MSSALTYDVYSTYNKINEFLTFINNRVLIIKIFEKIFFIFHKKWYFISIVKYVFYKINEFYMIFFGRILFVFLNFLCFGVVWGMIYTLFIVSDKPCFYILKFEQYFFKTVIVKQFRTGLSTSEKYLE